ncbi:ergothioneine biosynthesis protein EgtB [Qipengyuania sp. JC766]|uniref:ergothioneine biosynthesis protein EgtB n=1 Tax=Qipengyuania sp. JC766 TaxID=3232139 RepID=UPI00345B0F86
MPTSTASLPRACQGDRADRYRATRALSERLVEPLSDADATIQSMEDASPAKWHLAHTTWFWETFLLRDHLDGYRLFHEDYPFLFNSYYEAEGDRHARARRGMITRPTLAQVCDWRTHVDAAIRPLMDDPELAPLIDLGIAHEQQHQELLLTDIKHALFQNPLGPAMFAREAQGRTGEAMAQDWTEHPGGIARIGHQEDGFAYDNEGPRHRVLLEPFALADRLVTNGEWQDFIDDSGYAEARHWLSDGWTWVQENRIAAPLYWGTGDRAGHHFTHYGWQERDRDAPVTHISYFEADAFATWAGHRLPTEFEWEAVARGQHEDAAPAHDPAGGNQLDDTAHLVPEGRPGLFGDCWQFTRSAYLPYPRFRIAEGAVGEYNGKFMSGQFVLRGASCATVRGHSRLAYRNFFYPHQRWQFTGLRLAKDI